MATWKDMLEAEGVKLKHVTQIACDNNIFTLLHDWPSAMIIDFDEGYGVPKGCSFTLWTAEEVWFPVKYDGAEWIHSVPRHPCIICTNHIGGPKHD